MLKLKFDLSTVRLQLRSLGVQQRPLRLVER
jgi:hypothetical protein